jgi:hypothetical protein
MVEYAIFLEFVEGGARLARRWPRNIFLSHFKLLSLKKVLKMTYIIKIEDKSLKAKSIINMLKALKDDYDFIEIKKDNPVKPGLTLDKELDKRYKSFLKDNRGKEWEDLKSELK